MGKRKLRQFTHDLKCHNCGDVAVLQVFKGIVYARIDHEGVMEDTHRRCRIVHVL